MALVERLVARALEQGASDLHLEPGLSPVVRIRGDLHRWDEPVGGSVLLSEAQAMCGEMWRDFIERRSVDLSRNLAGVRCRLNIFQTTRGVAMAIRLLAPFQATLESLNLHPALGELVQRTHGLIVVSGPTGSGKSSTIAAFVEEINRLRARHIVTIEQPIEYAFRSRRSTVRQREVGRDTPSYEQALLDALRQDPDVVVVGEMRRPETIRLTLDAAETGHLVITTMHSGSVSEALHRIVSAFSPEAQASVAAQLAGSLVAVVCQRLSYRPDLGIRVPECEIAVATDPVRAVIRNQNLQRLPGIIQTGGADGMYSFDRYRSWLQGKQRFAIPESERRNNPLPDEQPTAETPTRPAASPVAARPSTPAPRTSPMGPAPASPSAGGVIDLDGEAEDLASILSEFD